MKIQIEKIYNNENLAWENFENFCFWDSDYPVENGHNAFFVALNEGLKKYSGKIGYSESENFMDCYFLEFEHEKDYLYFLMEWS